MLHPWISTPAFWALGALGLALSGSTALLLVGWACSLVVEVQISSPGAAVRIPAVFLPRLSWAQGRRTTVGRPGRALLVLDLPFASHHLLVVPQAPFLGDLVQL